MARRVNKKFLIILTAGVMAVLIVAGGLNYWMSRGNAKTLIAQADGEWAAANEAREAPEIFDHLRKAKDLYGRALRLKPGNAQVVGKVADVVHELTRFDINEVGNDAKLWERMLEMEPGNRQTLNKLLDAYIDRSEFDRSPQVYSELIQRKAIALANSDPGNLRAVAYQQIARLGEWMANVTKSDQEVEKILASLAELRQAAPDDPEIPLWMARARLRLAGNDINRATEHRQRALLAFMAAPPAAPSSNLPTTAPATTQPSPAQLQRVRQTAATTLARLEMVMRKPTSPPSSAPAASGDLTASRRQAFAQAVNAYDALLMQDCRDAVMLFHYFQVRSMLGRRDGTMADQAATQPAPETDSPPATAAATAIEPAVVALLERAAELVNSDHRDYIDIHLAAADLSAQQGRLEEARNRMESLLKKRPDDLKVRLAMSRLLRRQPGKLAEAAALLEKRGGDDPTLKGFRAWMRSHLEMRRLTDLLQVRLDMYAQATESDRPSLKQLIDDSYAQAIAVSSPEEPQLLKLKAFIVLLNPDRSSVVEAIGLLKKSSDWFKQRGQTDLDLNFRLAQCYLRLGETGQAETTLNQVVMANPNWPTPRAELVKLLLQQRQFEQAQRHIAQLDRQLPGSSDVLQLRIATLVGLGKTDEVGTLVSTLPEETDLQRLNKARALLWAGKSAEAETLLNALSAAEIKEAAGGECPASQVLTLLYLRDNRKTDAQRVIAATLERNPRNPRLKQLSLLAQGRSPTTQEATEMRELSIEAGGDPLAPVKDKYAALRKQNKREEALAVLLDAEKENPANNAVIEAIYNDAMERENWEQAGQYAAKLAKANFDQAGGLTYQVRLKLMRKDLSGALLDALDLTRRQDFSSSWVLLGKVQQANSQFDSALLSYAKALERQLDNFDALQGTVECYLQLGQLESARKYIAMGKQVAGTTGRFFAEVEAGVEEQRGDPSAVTAKREKDLADNQKNPDAWLALCGNYVRVAAGFLAQKNERAAGAYLAKAQARLTDALRQWPDDLRLNSLRADVSIMSGKPQEGVAILRGLADRLTDSAEPLRLLANHYQRMGADHWGEAEMVLKDMMVRAKNTVAARQLMAYFFIQTSQIDKALRLMDELVEQTKSPVLRRELIELQLQSGKFTEAETPLRAALAQSPNDDRLLALLGYVLFAKGDKPAAAKQVEAALQANPRSALAYRFRGLIKIGDGSIAGALEDLQRSRNLDAKDPQTRALLADVLRRRNQLDEASKELEAAVQMVPTSTDLRLNLYQLYAGMARWGLAERLLADAHEIPAQANNPLWWQLESAMWVERQNLQKAFECIQMVMKLKPTDSAAQYSLLDILKRSGQYEQIIALTDQALRQPPSSLPWWLHMFRGVALKATSKNTPAEEAFALAMSNAESLGGDLPGDVLTKTMVAAMGAKWTTEQLSARRDPKWEVYLVQAYRDGGDWKAAIATSDNLANNTLGKLDKAMQLRALAQAGLTYAIAPADWPGTAEKAEKIYGQLLAEMERQRVDINAQLGVLNNLAWVLSENPRSPNPARGLDYSKRAKETMDKAGIYLPNVVDTYGWVLVLNNRLDEGLSILEDVASRATPPPDVYYHLGEACLRKSRVTSTQRYLDSAQRHLETGLTAAKAVGGGQGDASLVSKIQASLAKVRQARGKGAPATRP